ncbi:MAG: hypothetical protein VSS75_002130 [Candidatus Parabeggiatoa sp.]|nr:hypothetical protein [Candidatus Parabeggiatoa sp.]
MTDKSNEVESHNDELISPDRREAMKKLGKYGAYTAPAVITLLASRKVPAASGAPPPTSP